MTSKSPEAEPLLGSVQEQQKLEQEKAEQGDQEQDEQERVRVGQWRIAVWTKRGKPLSPSTGLVAFQQKQ